MIKVLLNNQDITEFVTSVQWSGHSQKPNRELTLQIKNTTDGVKRALKIYPGDSVVFFVEGKKVFTGVLFNTNISSSGEESLTFYDRNVYLQKNYDTRKFSKTKASDIVKRLAKDFNIPTGIIEDTKYVIPVLIMRNLSLYDMMLKALVYTYKQSGKRFFLTSDENGRLCLRIPINNIQPYILAAGQNLMDASYSLSIEDTRTQVKVTGGKDNRLTHTVKSPNLQKKYGVMQHIEEMDEKATLSQVKQRAEVLLKEKGVIHDQSSISCIGIPSVITGCGIYAKEPVTNLAGGYYVTSDVHDFSRGLHTMQLEISKSLDMPDIEISNEELGIEG